MMLFLFAAAKSVASMATLFWLMVCIIHTPQPSRDWLSYKSVMNPEFSWLKGNSTNIEDCKSQDFWKHSKSAAILYFLFTAFK
jgi:hypothetical protein